MDSDVLKDIMSPIYLGEHVFCFKQQIFHRKRLSLSCAVYFAYSGLRIYVAFFFRTWNCKVMIGDVWNLRSILSFWKGEPKLFLLKTFRLSSQGLFAKNMANEGGAKQRTSTQHRLYITCFENSMVACVDTKTF